MPGSSARFEVTLSSESTCEKPNDDRKARGRGESKSKQRRKTKFLETASPSLALVSLSLSLRLPSMIVGTRIRNLVNGFACFPSSCVDVGACAGATGSSLREREMHHTHTHTPTKLHVHWSVLGPHSLFLTRSPPLAMSGESTWQ